MPIYVYECDTCGDVYEVEQRIIEDALTECRCGKGRVKRVMQPVGVAFKGSGFYVNDAPSAAAPNATIDKTETPEVKPVEVSKKEIATPETKSSE
ncbi:MAG: FmdB family zinc ribbon protein [Fimbriimonadaceae bacterium]